MMVHGYPRPQLQREIWQPLNGQWRFAFDDRRRFKKPSDIREWPLTITVPYPPESPASGIGDQGFHPICWFLRALELLPGDNRIMLHFGAVDYMARVWVNDLLVAEHIGGHTPFSADITFALRPDGHQTITVRAEDDPQDLAKPRGKQDWQLTPHSIWYPRTSGIWQTVWLEPVAATHIGEIRWTPMLERFSIDLDVSITGEPADDLVLDVLVTHGELLLARDSYEVIQNEVHRTIVFSDPGIDDSRNELLWSPERPTLLDVRLTLRQGNQVIDTVFSYTALRSVNIMRDRFMLNGRPYTLRLVLDQGYWPDTLMAAPSDEALRRDVELAKAMGFNGVRKHQKIEDPRYLYWADQLGLLVWEEMPSAYRFTSKSIRRLTREWTKAIDRDYSHPCIIVWVPFNESWGVPDLPSTPAHRNAVEALYHLTKTLDPTRPVIGNDGWESSATDMIGIHDYDANLEHIRQRYGPEVKREELFDRRRPGGRVLTLDGYPHRGQPIILTEFGGVAYGKCPQPGIPQIWGYSAATTDAEFLNRFHHLLELINNLPLFSGFCYTQFADTYQEANGLLCADRTPKIPLEAIRRAVTISRTHIPGGV